MKYFLIKLFRKLFHRPETKREVTVVFLEKAVKLAKVGKVQVLRGSPRVLNAALQDPANFPYVVIFKTTKFRKPKNLRGWFTEWDNLK